MGRGSTAVLDAPSKPVRGEGPSDHVLVAAVRRGDDRAFEALYSRYHRRIHAYVLGMCKDHGRAEDVTQEVFVSALRRMRETERPIAFKPWIYEIAKNACIDLFRRSRRTEEVPLEADDEFCGSELGRLAAGGPSPDAAVAAKQALDQLCGAFGGLSDVHHEILVMRELEGLSYREIGERLGMSRPAVESTLFRARRRLTEEYDELVSGQRCQRVQRIIATASEGRLGARDTRKLARHVAHCQPCRREALAAGLDSAALQQPLRTRVAAKVAGLLPFPWLARRLGGRGGGADAVAAASGGGGSASGWVTQLPAVSDQLEAGWSKAAAAAAVLVAGLGAGVGTHVVGASGASHPPAPAARVAATTSTLAASTREAALPRAGSSAAGRAVMVAGRRSMAAGRRHARHSTGRHHAAPHAGTSPAGGTGSVAAGGAPATRATGGSNPVAAGSGGGGSSSASSAPSGGGSGSPPSTQSLQVPTIVQPTSVPDPVSAVTAPIQSAVAPVTTTVQNTVQGTVGQALQQVHDTVAGLAPTATR